MADGGTISVATSGAGSAGSILLNANNLSLAGGAQVLKQHFQYRQCWQHLTQCQQLYPDRWWISGREQHERRWRRRTLELTASELVSISGAGSGLFSTASSTGNAGEITVAAPALYTRADIDDG